MRSYRLLMLVLASGILLAGKSYAANWSLTADSPLSYTFDKGNANLPPAGCSGSCYGYWDHRSTNTVGGSKVLLIAPFHLGVGYEDYSIAQTVTVPGCSGNGCAGKVKANLQIVDVAVDLPMRFLNFTLGYGAGQANADILVGTPSSARHANVSQTFVAVGIPLGSALDVHAGYHWVSVEKKDFSTGWATNQLLLSGQMLSAGLRLNF